ncbi:hypothetical protein [Brucella oryzae]|uniref:hypothetical protein n=1 Tax=Brucella oryzae TaxID=335286 RepID=UPI001FDEE816|nr:hypothetical protein [Brucella oryzae]
MIRTARIEILAEIIEYLRPAMRRGGTQLPAMLAASTALRMSQRGAPVRTMQRAVEKHLLIDKSKYGRMRAARFADMADFTSIVSG